MNSVELQAAIDVIPPLSKTSHGTTRWEERFERSARIKELEDQWREYLENTYAIARPGWKFSQDILDNMFSQAWDNGHSNGYYEVESYYQDLAEFAFKVRESVLSSIS